MTDNTENIEDVDFGAILETLNNKADRDLMNSSIFSILAPDYAASDELKNAVAGNIGDIKYTVRKGSCPYGGVWCDGITYTKSRFSTIYQMLIDNKLENVDIETYNSVLELNGSCGFFGLDVENETFRVPTLPSKYFTGTKENVPVVGNGMTLGLTNGTSEYGLGVGADDGVNARKITLPYGGLSGENVGKTSGFGEIPPTNSYGVTTNPDKSGIIANTSSLLDYVEYKPYVILFSGEDITSNIQIETQLNNPFSLLDYKWSEYEITNASWLISNSTFYSGLTYTSVYQLLLDIKNGTVIKDGVSVKLSTEEYTDYDFVLNATDETFRLPVKVHTLNLNDSDTLPVKGNGMTLGMTNGNQLLGMQIAQGSFNVVQREQNYGTSIGFNGTNSTTGSGTIGVTTDSSKSGIVVDLSQASNTTLKLYFYVGETIQDANLINANGVLSRVAELSDNYISGLGMPDYSAGISQTEDIEYTAERSGVLYINVQDYNTNSYITINGEKMLIQHIGSNQASNTLATYLIGRGDIYLVEFGRVFDSQYITFYPCRGEK